MIFVEYYKVWSELVQDLRISLEKNNIIILRGLTDEKNENDGW